MDSGSTDEFTPRENEGVFSVSVFIWPHVVYFQLMRERPWEF